MTLAMKATLYFSPSERCSARPRAGRKNWPPLPALLVLCDGAFLSHLPRSPLAVQKTGRFTFRTFELRNWYKSIVGHFYSQCAFFVHFLLTHLTTGVLVKCISVLQMLAYYYKNHIFFLLRFTCYSLCAAVMHGRHNINKVLLPWEVHKPFSSVLSFVF